MKVEKERISFSFKEIAVFLLAVIFICLGFLIYSYFVTTKQLKIHDANINAIAVHTGLIRPENTNQKPQAKNESKENQENEQRD